MFERPPGIDLEQIFLLIYRLLTGAGEEVTLSTVQSLMLGLWIKIAIVSSIITPILLTALAYVLIRNRQMRMEEAAAFKAKARLPHASAGAPKNEKWERVLSLISSDRPSDWRVAILEADVLLDELLISRGYVGDNLGERLKSIGGGDMETLEQAWEAHKARNALAHGRSDEVFTNREARRVIDLFRQVFEEFDYI
ncbi:MAG TPA: hypothetical protein VGA06_00800 [Candidatus Paceibacterota bacterium]|jgi:hypothetical protein